MWDLEEGEVKEESGQTKVDKTGRVGGNLVARIWDALLRNLNYN